MKTLSEALNIEVAGGGDLQYLGLIEIDISRPEIDPVVTFPTPVLVVDNTNFSKKSPFVIGKNIINPCMKFLKQRDGEQFLQKVKLSDSWRSAIQCNSLRIKPSSGKLGQVICHRQVVIPPNSTHTITGSTRSCTLGKTLVMTDAEEFTQLPAGLMVDPILQEVDFPNRTHKKMNVQIFNLTNSQITIPSTSTVTFMLFPWYLHPILFAFLTKNYFNNLLLVLLCQKQKDLRCLVFSINGKTYSLLEIQIWAEQMLLNTR